MRKLIGLSLCLFAAFTMTNTAIAATANSFTAKISVALASSKSYTNAIVHVYSANTDVIGSMLLNAGSIGVTSTTTPSSKIYLGITPYSNNQLKSSGTDAYYTNSCFDISQSTPVNPINVAAVFSSNSLSNNFISTTPPVCN